MDKSSKLRKWLTSASLLAIVAGVTPIAHGAAASASASAPKAPVISLGSHRTAQITDVHALNKDGHDILTFDVQVHNGSTSAFAFTDYFLELQNTPEIQYDLSLMPEDQGLNYVPAGGDVTFHFYSKLTPPVGLDKLTLKLMKWDFSKADMADSIGQAQLQESATAAGTASEVDWGTGSVNATVGSWDAEDMNSSKSVSIQWKMTNDSGKTVTLPDLSFYLISPAGTVYPLQAQGFQAQMDIQPFATISAQLTGNIPLNAGKTGWKLSVAQNIGGSTGSSSGSSSSGGSGSAVTAPMNLFTLPAMGSGAAQNQQSFNYSTTAGTYSYSLNAVYRLPWQDQDELVADYSVTNNGKQTIPIPQLTGYYMLDNAVKVNASAVFMDNLLGIAPGQTVHLQMVGKIPYSDSFTGMQIYLQDNSGSAPAEITHFDASRKLKSIPDVAVGKSYTLGDIGHTAIYQIADEETYAGDSDEIYSATLQAQNGEKRETNLTQLVGYFEAPNGDVYPATISDGGGQVTPGGKGLLTVWTALPKGTDTTGMKLVLGEALASGKLAGASDTPDAYTQAFALDMPKEDSTVQDHLDSMSISPYSLTLSNLGVPFVNKGTNAFTFKFDYTLNRDLTVNRNVSDHQYLIELVDGNGQVITSQSYSLDNTGSTSSSSNALQTGTHSVTISTSVNSESIAMQYYTINVYDVFQSDHKKLLASESFGWYGDKPVGTN